jgi:hypothetical protein
LLIIKDHSIEPGFTAGFVHSKKRVPIGFGAKGFISFRICIENKNFIGILGWDVSRTSKNLACVEFRSESSEGLEPESTIRDYETALSFKHPGNSGHHRVNGQIRTGFAGYELLFTNDSVMLDGYNLKIRNLTR